MIAYFNYVTRVADGVGIEDEPEWTRAGPDSARAEIRSREDP